MFFTFAQVCANFGSVCVCKLARWLHQTAPELKSLQSLRISGNRLTTVPDPVWYVGKDENETDIQYTGV